jgi:soluble lytic murein transglycosylase-like protein
MKRYTKGVYMKIKEMKRVLKKYALQGGLGLLALHFISHGMVAIESDLKDFARANYKATILYQAQRLGFNLSAKVTPLTINEIIAREIKINELSPAYAVIFKAIIQAESNGDSYATSSADARGLSQVHHSNAKYCGYHKNELYENEKNLTCGVRLFSEALKEANYDLIKALKIYNSGSARVDKTEENRIYPTYVLKRLKELR